MHLRGCLCWTLLAAIAGLVAAEPAAAKERIWTSTDGRTLRGEFVRELDGEVTLLVGGKLQTVPLDRLSERDRQAVRDLAAGKPVAEDASPDASGATAKPATDDPFSGPASTPAAAGDAASEKPEAASGPVPLIKKPMAAVIRSWTDNQGKQTTGKFVRVFNGNVVLARANAKPVSIPFFDLVEADQQYVRELLTSRGEESLIPTPAATSSSPAPVNRGNPPPAAATLPMPGAGPGPAAGVPGASSPGSNPPGARPPGDSRLFGPARPRPPGGYDPGAASDSAGGSSGGASDGYGAPPSFPPTILPPTSTDSPLDEQQRRAEAAAAAARRDAERLLKSQEEGMIHSPPSELVQTRVPACSACKNTLTAAEATGTQCPHCGARWTFNDYAGSTPPATAASAPARSTASAGPGVTWGEMITDPEAQRAAFGGVLVVVVLVVLTGIVAGVIAVVTAISAASRGGRQYRDLPK